MGIRRQNLLIILVLLIGGLSVIPVYGQINSKPELQIIHLDTPSVVSNQLEFKNMVSKIVSNGKFRYRKTLRHSKSTNKQYEFNNIKISEVEVLRHFKKAARTSGTVQEFKFYFSSRNLKFIEMLDGDVISSLYSTIRQKTFNGKLENWQTYY